MTYEQIARVCHAANREYCKVMGLPVREEWDNLDQSRRDVVIAGVAGWVEGRFKNPEDSHNNWMHDMLEKGWRYGPQRNEERKLHECLVPYRELPEADRFKDTLFMSIVKAFVIGGRVL